MVICFADLMRGIAHMYDLYILFDDMKRFDCTGTPQRHPGIRV